MGGQGRGPSLPGGRDPNAVEAIPITQKPKSGGSILGNTRRSSVGGDKSPAPPEAAAVKLSPEEVKKKTEGLFAEYLGPGGDIVEAIECMKELIPGNCFGTVVTKLYMDTLEKKDTDQAKIGALVLACLEKKLIKGEDVVEALNAVLGEVEELQMDIPKVGVIAATFCGQFLAVEGELASLSSGFETLKDSNKAVKTLLLTLNVIKEIKTEDFARECFSSSAIDFKTLVADYIPAEEADAEVADNIKSAKADWLMPLLGAEEYLRTSYGNGTASAEMVGWVQEHVAAGLIQDAKFAHIMMRALLNHTESKKDVSVVKQYASLFQTFFQTEDEVLPEHLLQQKEMLFEVQLFCHERDFREKCIMNLFKQLYEDDIIEEDAYTAWSEDTDNTTPNKMKAIMEANKFLTWLQEQNEESDEEDDDE